MTPVDHTRYWTLPDCCFREPVEPDLAHLNLSQHAAIVAAKLSDDVVNVEVDDFIASNGSVSVVLIVDCFGEVERYLYTLDAEGKLHIH